MGRRRSRLYHRWVPDWGLSDAGRSAAIHAVEQRLRRRLITVDMVSAIPAPLGFVLYLLWGRISPNSVMHPNQLLNALASLVGDVAAGWIWFLVFVAGLPVLLLAASCFAAWKHSARLVSNEIRRCLHQPACLHCGYDLAGVLAQNRIITCPECGRKSPTIRTERA